MLPSHTLSKLRPELVAPKTNRFITDGEAPFGEQVFDVTVAQEKPMIEPHGILDDFSRESVTLVNF